MSAPTPGPWASGQYGAVRGLSGMLFDARGDHIGTTFNGPEDARRIVACVNAMAGIGDDNALFSPGNTVRAVISSMALKRVEIEKQRDELRAALEFVMSAHGEQLGTAFAQAQEALAKAKA